MPTELGPISSAPRQLRPEVQVRVTNGEIELVDLSTSLVVDVAVQGSLEQLLADDEVWDGLKELGLAADGASRAEIIQRQRQFNQESRAERWADFLKRCLSTRHYARHAARLTGADDGLAGFITTKDQLRAAPEDFVFDKINSARGLEDGSVGLATSSGTTGERLQVFGDPWLLELPLHFRPCLLYTSRCV